MSEMAAYFYRRGYLAYQKKQPGLPGETRMSFADISWWLEGWHDAHEGLPLRKGAQEH